jgi:hypothetical protein
VGAGFRVLEKKEHGKQFYQLVLMVNGQRNSIASCSAAMTSGREADAQAICNRLLDHAEGSTKADLRQLRQRWLKDLAQGLAVRT